MIDLSQFSGLFPELSTFFQKPPQVPVPAPPQEDAQEPEGDSFERTSRASNGGAASYGRIPARADGPVSVAPDGTYSPMLRRGVGFGFGFSLNLNVSRMTVATRALRPARTPDPASQQKGALARAREVGSLLYQSHLNESQRGVATGFSESRRMQAELFYSRTREISLNLDSARASQFGETSQRVARKFELSISLEFSFLSQFTTQSGTISDLDDDLFGQYLQNTDGMTARSADAIQSFFDDVDRILAGTEAMVKETLGSFFSDVAATFDLSEEEARALMSLVSDEVTAFFDDVDRFLSDARASLGALPAPAPTAIEAAEPQVDTPDVAEMMDA